MSLRDAITRVDMIGISPPNMPPPESVRLRHRAKELAAQFSFDGDIPQPEDIQVLTMRLLHSSVSQNFNEISKRDWKKAAWCLWNKENPLAANENFLSAYMERLRIWHRRGRYGSLIKAYLRDFDPKDQTFFIVAKEIRSVVEGFDWPWADRHRFFKLFDEQEAPKKIAAVCLTHEDSPETGLSEVGLTGELSYGGMARAAYTSALSNLERLQENPREFEIAIDRMLEWSVDKDNELRFPGMQVPLADALLLPWFSSTPPKELQKKIQEFLVRYLKDPRVDTAEWVGAEDARSVMLLWLTKVALEQFLEVVDRVAKPSMWKFRRAFWTAYFNAGYISEAWVVFGEAGARELRRSFEKASVGRLESGYKSVEHSHAALIMKLGDLTIADWSHNGKCEIWLQNNPNAPRLYRSRYVSDEIMHNSDNGGVVHAGSDTGSWQRKVSGFIRQHTGISMTIEGYMPKRS